MNGRASTSSLVRSTHFASKDRSWPTAIDFQRRNTLRQRSTLSGDDAANPYAGSGPSDVRDGHFSFDHVPIGHHIVAVHWDESRPVGRRRCRRRGRPDGRYASSDVERPASLGAFRARHRRLVSAGVGVRRLARSAKRSVCRRFASRTRDRGADGRRPVRYCRASRLGGI